MLSGLSMVQGPCRAATNQSSSFALHSFPLHMEHAALNGNIASGIVHLNKLTKTEIAGFGYIATCDTH